ncbi:MAG: T9SS type A sorting domain-containing protein [Bacteroidales bacterium]|nr:T9SS type A sorting domain-containing protein [Bacteroidales bacterium]MCF8336926.1 T9SS type A sorting domain-containing protein [Bacteroidales bacterium]
MKKLITNGLITLLLFTGPLLFSQTYTYDDARGAPGYSVEQQRDDKTVVNFSIEKFALEEITINGDAMKDIQLPGHYLPNDEGAPNLPGKGRYIAVPENAEVELNITDKRKEVIENVKIAPAPRIPKENEVGPLEYNKDEKIYNKDAFYPAEPIKLSEKDEIRGFDVVMLGITPFQYNPVSEKLIVYRDIKVEVTYTGGSNQFGEAKYRSRWFDPLIKDAVLNKTVIPEKDYTRKFSGNSREEGCEYLIVSPDGEEFQQWADSIKRFRNMQGIHTKVVTLSEIGANDPDVLESYFDEAYNTWDTPPSAVLLLGDYGDDMENRVISPIYDGYCASDNIYADVTGNHLPDMVFGRITAQNAEQLEVMVSKFIDHEKDPPTNEDYYDNPITALGWQTERWFQICSESIHGFWKNEQGKDPRRENVIYSGNTDVWSTATNTETVVDYFGPDGQGYIEETPDYLPPFDGSAEGVNEGINSGAFMLQHRDHGSETGWGEPDYDMGDIEELTNTDLTFVMSINCLTGKYNMSGECFAEKFHRHTHNGEPSGALGVIAASETSYSFVNDTYVWGMYDNMWPDFMPDYGTTPDSRDVKPAFGNAGGKYHLQQSDWPYNTGDKEVTYHLFHHHGGTFSTVYSEMPQELDVVHNDVLLSGPDSFEVTANEGSLIALSVDGEILGTAEGTGAPVDIPIEPQEPGTVVDIVITKQNFYRYHEQIEVIPPDGPYVINEDFEINDEQGNNNSEADYGEELMITLTVENFGNDPAEDVMVTLESDDPYVTITDDSENYGDIPPESTATVENGFTVQVDDSIPDNHNVAYDVIATSNEEEWVSGFNMKIYSPVLEIKNMQVVETEGNGNDIIDPGESADLFIQVKNDGHCKAEDVLSSITTTSATCYIDEGEYTIENLQSDSTKTAQFSISVDSGAFIGSFIDIENLVAFPPYGDEQPFSFKVGLIMEDFESGDFSQFDWENEGDADWFITEDPVYEGVYSSQSGTISNSENSQLKISYEVMFDDTISFYRKVSSESGYDYLYFLIDGEVMGSWSGEQDWAKVEFPVSAGEHTFTWKYEKDGYQSNGEDCAWVDNIVLPPEVMTMVYAGQDIHGCQMNTVEIDGAAATYYNSVEWETSGSGTFDSHVTMHPEYTPSQEDFENGQVILTLTVNGEEGDQETDAMVVYLPEKPEVSAPQSSTICAGDSLVMENIEAAHFSDLLWTTQGNGSFSDSTVVAPVYYPGEEEINSGSANLSLNVMGMGTCADTSIDVNLTINSLPTATLSSGEEEICEGQEATLTVQLTGEAPWTLELNDQEYTDVTEDEWTHSFIVDDTTAYTLGTVVDANGCANSGEGSYNIVMSPLPQTPQKPSGTDTVDLVYDSMSVYTTLPPMYANTHEWTLDPEEAGTLLADDTAVTVSWSDQWTGDAEIKVTAVNDCGDSPYSEAQQVKVRNTIGFGDDINGEGVSIYPNPTEGVFYLSADEGFEESVNVKVMDALSNLVLHKEDINISKTRVRFDLSNNGKGIYLLIIETNNNRTVKRLVIQ